ncbi:hypothetical protein BV25DRAFT_900720 [Artomyces pyxidatus]|uniref:Uncharacterized protein n=1 Tax=Artomyces pyxidatus TaxID=48021 RepID=A0ACB8SWE9_9AGAM|nr:hypothetical protein BV25DRAFT_900720 [Artomyces pyxidatus]
MMLAQYRPVAKELQPDAEWRAMAISSIELELADTVREAREKHEAILSTLTNTDVAAREQADREYNDSMDDVRAQAREALQARFDGEIARRLQALGEAIEDHVPPQLVVKQQQAIWDIATRKQPTQSAPAREAPGPSHIRTVSGMGNSHANSSGRTSPRRVVFALEDSRGEPRGATRQPGRRERPAAFGDASSPPRDTAPNVVEIALPVASGRTAEPAEGPKIGNTREQSRTLVHPTASRREQLSEHRYQPLGLTPARRLVPRRGDAADPRWAPASTHRQQPSSSSTTSTTITDTSLLDGDVNMHPRDFEGLASEDTMSTTETTESSVSGTVTFEDEGSDVVESVIEEIPVDRKGKGRAVNVPFHDDMDEDEAGTSTQASWGGVMDDSAALMQTQRIQERLENAMKVEEMAQRMLAKAAEANNASDRRERMLNDREREIASREAAADARAREIKTMEDEIRRQREQTMAIVREVQEEREVFRREKEEHKMRRIELAREKAAIANERRRREVLEEEGAIKRNGSEGVLPSQTELEARYLEMRSRSISEDEQRKREEQRLRSQQARDLVYGGEGLSTPVLQQYGQSNKGKRTVRFTE